MNTKRTLPKTTKHHTYILFLLYRFRFLTTHHIQYYMQHKLTTRIRSWLAKLYIDGYIDRYHSNVTFEKNSQPAIYWLTSLAKYPLKKNPDCDPYILDRLYKEKGLKVPFRNHCLFLADIAIKLEEECKEKDAIIGYFTQRELNGYNHFPKPLPDAFFEITQPKKRIKRYFLELLDTGMPRYAMRARINRYFTCSESEEWKKEMHMTFPTIVLICPDEATKRSMEKHIKEKLEEASIELIFLVRIKNKILHENILEI